MLMIMPQHKGIHIFSFAIGFICIIIGPVSYADISLATFNPPPKLPYEKTSVHQDDCFERAQRLQGDSKEADALAACQELVADSTAPAELRRWASLRQIELNCYISHEDEAVKIAQEWIKANPNDPKVNEVIAITALIYRDRRSARFQPSLQEVVKAHEELIKDLDPQDWQVIRAHYDLALRLMALSNNSTLEGQLLQGRIMYEINTTREALENKIENGSPEDQEKAQKMIKEEIEPLTRIDDKAFTYLGSEQQLKMHQQFLDSLRAQGVSEKDIQSFEELMNKSKPVAEPNVPAGSAGGTAPAK